MLREVQGDRQAMEAALALLAERGAPNYFGLQRFGFQGGNLERAVMAIEALDSIAGPVTRIRVESLEG